jgi:hypothetical protein
VVVGHHDADHAGTSVSFTSVAVPTDCCTGSSTSTRALKIESLGGDALLEKSYGAGRPGPSDVCVAQHGPFPGEDYPGSRWTVTLQRTA